jgi:hypothetical protein
VDLRLLIGILYPVIPGLDTPVIPGFGEAPETAFLFLAEYSISSARVTDAGKSELPSAAGCTYEEGYH